VSFDTVEFSTPEDRMKFGSLVAGLAFIIDPAAIAQAAEIKVLGAAFLRPVVDELGPQFEQSTGHKLAIKWVPGPAIGREADPGERFDVAMSQATTIDDMIKTGKLDHTSRAELARAGLAVAVHAGAPKPDVTSVEGFKRALLSAKSIAISPESVSGAYLAEQLDRFGIASEVKPKIISPPVNTGGAFGMVARGSAEIGVAAAAVVPGTELARFPAERQRYQAFVGAIGTSTKEPEAAKELFKFFASEAAAPVIKAKGMEPPHPN